MLGNNKFSMVEVMRKTPKYVNYQKAPNYASKFLLDIIMINKQINHDK